MAENREGWVIMREEYVRTIEEFQKTQPAKKLMVRALKEISPDRDNWVGWFISVALGAVIAVVIGFSAETVALFADALELFIGVQLGIFGCIFTVYSIILAFLSDDYMKKLAKVPYDGKQSMLTRSTTYYESALFLYFINIGLTGALLLLCKCLPAYFRLTASWRFDCCLAAALMAVYFSYSFRVFYEIKSAIYNTVFLFRGSIAYKFIAFSIDESDER